MPSVVNIMIDTVFNFGTPKHKNDLPYIGKDLTTQMHIGLGLLMVAIICIPIMLLVKPCCFRGDPPPEDEKDEIEFTNINNRGNEPE